MEKEKCIHYKTGKGCSLFRDTKCDNCSFCKTKLQTIKELKYCIEHNEEKRGVPDEVNRKILKEYL